MIYWNISQTISCVSSMIWFMQITTSITFDSFCFCFLFCLNLKFVGMICLEHVTMFSQLLDILKHKFLRSGII